MSIKFQKSAEEGIKYKLPVVLDRYLENAAKVLDDIGLIGQNEPAKRIAAEIRSYRGLEYRECPKSEGCVDEQAAAVAADDWQKKGK